jgi:hypothetical protein
LQALVVAPLEVTADHVMLYKCALPEAGLTSATVARRLSVLRGAYKQLAAKGLISRDGNEIIASMIEMGEIQREAVETATKKSYRYRSVKWSGATGDSSDATCGQRNERIG